MKHSLTVVTLFALAGLATLAVRSETGISLDNFAVASSEATPPKLAAQASNGQRPDKLAAIDGNLVMAQAAVEMKQLPSLEAKLRLQTHMLGQELSGSGSYYQLVRSPETLFKLELKLQVANQVSSLLHVGDGRFLWTRRDLPTHKFLGRVDQRRVSEALASAKRQPLPAAGTNLLALGGLGRLLETLNANFQFSPPREQSQAGATTWTLQGTWRPAALAALWPEKAAALEAGESIDLAELPEQIPSHVIVVLSRDPALPLFPQRIDYQRGGGAGESTSLVTIELFDVRRNVALDPRLFAYTPGDQEVQDQTEEYLRGLGL